MNDPKTTTWRRRIGAGTVSISAAAAVTALGLSAAQSSAAPGEQATTRAGSCATSYSSAGYEAKYGGKQKLIGRTPAGAMPDGVATEPVFSLDSRANKRLAYVSTSSNIAGGARAGTRNVYIVKRGGQITAAGNDWAPGETVLLTQGTDGPANGDSYAPSLSGYTGSADAAKGPSKIAFLSKATNLPGGNPTGVSAYVASANGGGIKRLNVPGEATGVGISGDSKVVYVTTTAGIYVVKGTGAGKKLASGGGMNSPTTTLNGKQAAFAQSGTIYTITVKGAKKKIAAGSDPRADAGFPGGGAKQGLIRAVSFSRGGAAYKTSIIAQKRGTMRVGASNSPTAINGGGSAVVFGNGRNTCVIVDVLESGKHGGYDVPQGQCPTGQGDVTDTGVSTRYNYVAFSCSGGGLYLYYVGGK